MKCDAAKFAGMYEQIYKDLYRFALCLMHNPQDAEDAVSDAVVNAYEHRTSLRDETAFKSWMFTILSNICKKKWKKKAKQQTEDMDDYLWIRDPKAEGRSEISLDLRRAFALLAEDEQMIIALSVFGGYQSKEIAQILALKDGTVRSKRSRALAKMSTILDPHGSGDYES